MSRVASLRALLGAFEPTPDELDAVQATYDLLESGEVALSADHYVPGHVTASAFVLDPSRRQLLLIHHRKLGTWLQPGGHVDDGEGVFAAAVREVREETGVNAVRRGEGIFDLDVHPIPPSGVRPAHKHFDVRFLLDATSDELIASDEVLGARWVALEDISATVTDRSVLRAAAKLQACNW